MRLLLSMLGVTALLLSLALFTWPSRFGVVCLLGVVGMGTMTAGEGLVQWKRGR